MRHCKIDEVCETYAPEGAALDVPVCLRLNVRKDLEPQFYALSWRSRYLTSPGQNRRYYWTKADGFWRIPTWLAKNLLERALDRGLLATEYDDQELRHGGVENGVICVSHRMSLPERRRLFDSITFEDDQALNWGPDPIFVVAEMADSSWRKIMIVDTARKICTFRSTTTCETYVQRDRQRRNGRWFLDRSMQDASSALMRHFLDALRSFEGE